MGGIKKLCGGNSREDTRDIRNVLEKKIKIILVKKDEYYIPMAKLGKDAKYCPYLDVQLRGLCTAAGKEKIGFCYHLKSM